MSSLQKSMLKSKLPPTGLNCGGVPPRTFKPRALQRKRDYDPIQWSPYFDHSEDVEVGENTFHVYTVGTEGATLVLLHGGGYSGLTWAEFTKCIVTMVVCRVMAIDLRGHGDSHTTNEEDLSADTLASDVAGIIESVSDDQTPIILVGHSMGGAVAVKAAPLLTNLAGVVVIDVVEGTAMDALTSMQSFLRSRPSSFNSISQAIEWWFRKKRPDTECTVSQGISSRTNKKVCKFYKHYYMFDVQSDETPSYKVLHPCCPYSITTGKLATHDIESLSSNPNHENEVDDVVHREDVIQEEEVSNMPPPPHSNKSENKNYAWRIDLAKTEQHWSGWFKGLSAAFLNIPSPKMLLLAGVDRLDRELTVGQMQGKFQMQVLPACGHAVHEDVPDKVAEAVATFLVRHKFAEPASEFTRTFPAC